MIAAPRPGSFFSLLAAILLPATCGWAHSTDFILAKVSPRAGRVDVELTADYGGNPMFQNKAEAQAALTHVLRARTGDGVTPRELSALAPLRFEDRTALDPTAPIPIDPTVGGEPHQILTAVWSWPCDAQKISFEMPADSNQSVILWTSPGAQSQSNGDAKTAAPGKNRWVFLLPGDVSPSIDIPPRTKLFWLLSCASLGLVGITAAVGFNLAFKRRRALA